MVSNLLLERRCNGAGRRIRTDDLLITNQLLYQLSYAGILEEEPEVSGDRATPQPHFSFAFSGFSLQKYPLDTPLCQALQPLGSPPPICKSLAINRSWYKGCWLDPPMVTEA